MTPDATPDAAPEPKGPGPYQRLHARLHANPVTGLVTKIVVTVVGTIVVLAGVVLSGPGIPGPGLLVIVAGLAILATEWTWAEKLLDHARAWLHRQSEKVRAMDPAVRRRRMLLTAAVALVVAGVTTWLLWRYGWPSFAVTSWDRVQQISDAVPELPGMP